YRNGGINWRVIEGYGRLVARHGAELPIAFGTRVERVDYSGKSIVVTTDRGSIAVRAVIVTVSTNLIAREAIRFVPALPDKIEAAAGLPLGIADKLYLGIEGPVEDLPHDRHLIGALDRVATGGYQVRPHGWPMIGAYFGGALATALEREGMDGMVAFAIDELCGLFGSAFRRRLKPLARSAWVLDPYANGSYSCALPGHADDRLILATPVDERLFFAGEACSVEFFGTAHGAFISAGKAAQRLIAALAINTGKATLHATS
ncbi:MAG: flavin monoamine oxidase family protein, partial [Stellaceae bacterium]